MKNARRKKKQKPPPNKVEDKKGVVDKKPAEEEEETKRIVLEALVEAFSLSSIDEAAMAYTVAGGDPGKASEILRRGLTDTAEDSFFPSSSASSSSGGSSGVSSGLDFSSSTSGSSDGFLEPSFGDFKGGKQKKKVVAAAGTVSTVLGKEYVRRNATRNKGFRNGFVEKEDAEQFLCSMLGDDCDLNLAVVRDVLCEYLAFFAFELRFCSLKLVWTMTSHDFFYYQKLENSFVCFDFYFQFCIRLQFSSNDVVCG